MRLKLWHEARAHAVRNWRLLGQVALVVGTCIALINLPLGKQIPYLQGLLTGVLLTALVGAVLWLAWVPSGLVYRLMGTWAEEATTEVLDKNPNVRAHVSNVRLNDREIDHVALMPSGIAVIETKWSSDADPGRQLARVQQAVSQVERAARTLRLKLRRDVPETLLLTLVVLWGPGARGWAARQVTVDGVSAWVVAGDDLDAWLAAQSVGLLPASVGEGELAALLAYADRYDETVQAGRALRYLARVR